MVVGDHIAMIHANPPGGRARSSRRDGSGSSPLTWPRSSPLPAHAGMAPPASRVAGRSGTVPRARRDGSASLTERSSCRHCPARVQGRSIAEQVIARRFGGCYRPGNRPGNRSSAAEATSGSVSSARVSKTCGGQPGCLATSKRRCSMGSVARCSNMQGGQLG